MRVSVFLNNSRRVYRSCSKINNRIPRNRTQYTQECKGAKDHSAKGFSISLNGAQFLVPNRQTSTYYRTPSPYTRLTYVEQWLSILYVHPQPLLGDAPCLCGGGGSSALATGIKIVLFFPAFCGCIDAAVLPYYGSMPYHSTYQSALRIRVYVVVEHVVHTMLPGLYCHCTVRY